MLKKTIIILALLAICAGTTAALAQHGHGQGLGKGHGRGGDTEDCDMSGPHGPRGERGHRGHRGPHGGHGMSGMHSRPHLPSNDVLKEWGADDATIAKLRDIEEKYTDKGIDLKADVAKAEKALQRLRNDEDVTEAAWHEAIDTVFEAKADLRKLHASAMFEAKEAMGDELFAKFHQKRRGRRSAGD